MLTAECYAGMVRGYRGTLHYMAPEQVMHRLHALLAAQSSGSLPDDTYELDGRACDTFALGLVAYQFLTGRFPFPRLMASGEYHNHFLALESLAQLDILAAAYHNWRVSSPCSCLWVMNHVLLFNLAHCACPQGSTLVSALNPYLDTSLMSSSFHGNSQPVCTGAGSFPLAACMLSIVMNAEECHY